jgi:hypothetical protein
MNIWEKRCNNSGASYYAFTASGKRVQWVKQAKSCSKSLKNKCPIFISKHWDSAVNLWTKFENRIVKIEQWKCKYNMNLYVQRNLQVNQLMSGSII